MSDKKPETPAEWAAYRCQASCKLGRDVLTRDEPIHLNDDMNRVEYTLFNLFHAVEDLSKQVELLSKTKELP